jgi:hypothetical protein
LLEEFIPSELEGTLEEVTSKGRANTGPDGTKSFLSNNFSESTNETAVILERVELYSGLDAVYMRLADKTFVTSQQRKTYTSTGVKAP